MNILTIMFFPQSHNMLTHIIINVSRSLEKSCLTDVHSLLKINVTKYSSNIEKFDKSKQTQIL